MALFFPVFAAFGMYMDVFLFFLLVHAHPHMILSRLVTAWAV